jgi:eukaryotic-like serine/threonine-protein kinase
VPNLVGQSLGFYHILEKLGESAIATVYLAFDTCLERDVVIKLIWRDAFAPDQLERILNRFEQEIGALGRLSHPNIVKVYDFGEFEGSPYLVMEYLPGGTLKQLLGKPIPWQEAARIILPIAHALQHAHEERIIHRDVNPSNILITLTGEPMLSGFGIARILEAEDSASRLTGSSVGLGTREYMAPEQLTGQVSPQVDIYSLGVVFYEMVTGRKLYQADTPATILLKQATEPLPPPMQFVQGLPEAVVKVLFKALANKPENRYGSMDGFAASLETLLTGKHRAVKPPVDLSLTQVEVISNPGTVEKAESLETFLDEKGQSCEPENPFLARSGLFPNTAQAPNKLISSPWTWLALAGGAGCLLLMVLGIAVAFLFGWFKANPVPGTSSTHIPTQTVQDRFTPVLLTDTPIPGITAERIPSPTDKPEPSPTFTPSPSFTYTPSPTATNASISAAPMVDVPAGYFTMGDSTSHASSVCQQFSAECDTITFSDEAPAHSVYLDAYRIDKTEVSNAMYSHCVKDGPCTDNNGGSNNYPAVNVTWNEADTFCKWVGRRLPTEAEWEKAARGTDGRIFPWGNYAPSCSLANFDPSSSSSCNGSVVAVDSNLDGHSPYGAVNMAGNVWEWVADWFDGGYYSNFPSSNPAGPGTGTYRVMRGGSYINPEGYMIPTRRGMNKPDRKYGWLGFRCAANP